MARKKSSDPTAMFAELYQPEFLPKNLRIRDFIDTTSVQDAQKTVKSANTKRALSELMTSKPKPPLTPEEAELIDQKIAQLLNQVERINSKITKAEDGIDALLTDGEKELSFTLNIKKMPRLKKAVKVLFGYKTDTITYTMYKKALKIKKALEDAEIPELFEE
tara:strand:- start:70 stop:558 length:489 start_codon:yes stop_codon:yes gene_type:complete